MNWFQRGAALGLIILGVVCLFIVGISGFRGDRGGMMSGMMWGTMGGSSVSLLVIPIILLAALLAILLVLFFHTGKARQGSDEETVAQAQETKDERTCLRCGKPMAPDWNVCPYCGATLQRAP